ncbi:hypothetical protein N7449_008312 [Penicillium cf. viridicatum]|uniref:C2H2-type domain-containing protein n=1 Tax=Penicillium cf. viridicatum TaxID=2972119 RepID=A0A9W9J892_9EURO|nr:hypothetical protein N7449_008312 [Penicillium cf. viridicatum]
MPTRRCSYCDRSFSKLEHFKRHERSRKSSLPLASDALDLTLTTARYWREALQMLEVPQEIWAKGHDGHSSRENTPQQSTQNRGQPPNTSDHVPTPGHTSPPGVAVTDNVGGADLDANRHTQAQAASPNLSSEAIMTATLDAEQGDESLDRLLAMPLPLSLDLPDVNMATDYGFEDLGYPDSSLISPFDPALTHNTPLEGQCHENGHDKDHVWPSGGNTTLPPSDGISWSHFILGDAQDPRTSTPTWLQPLETSEERSGGLDCIPRSQLRRTSNNSYDMSDERFAELASLWLRKPERPWQLMHTLWTAVAAHGGNNILSEAPDKTFPLNLIPSPASDTRGEVDDDRRSSIVEEYRAASSLGRRIPKELRFPTAPTLEICIDLYFRRFHPLMPIIHEPTFCLNDTPNFIVFPICLIGLHSLHPIRTRSFVATYVLDHRSPLSSLQAMTSRAGRPGLELSPQNGVQLPLPSDKMQANPPILISIIACLIMIDSFYSHELETSPIVRIDTLRLYLPCSTVLFSAPDQTRWSLVQSSKYLSTPHPTLDFRANHTTLPPGLPSSSLSMHTLLSTVWLRISDLRHRFLPSPAAASISETPLFPLEVYQEDPSGTLLSPMLHEIYQTYHADLPHTDPNYLAFWHYMCINLTANLSLFDLAAGRDGATSARAALTRLAIWAQTAHARRACLHAAQVYACMSRRKVSDGTTFTSETALFRAALVLAFFLIMAPEAILDRSRGDLDLEGTANNPNATAPGDVRVFDLLDEVDWRALGAQGLPGCTTSDRRPISAAGRFVAGGGTVAFGGVVLDRGRISARKVLVEFIYLLEEVGKWNSHGECNVLRAVSEGSG